MAEITPIDYADATWSPWIGCDKHDEHGALREGCRHCYAEMWSRRNPRFRGHWGRDKPRYFFGEQHWKQPLRWQRKCEREGTRRRVLVSLCDPFECLPGRHPDSAQQSLAFLRFWQLVKRTPRLDWLVLTKRPENFDHCGYLDIGGEQLPNLWLGVSVWDQPSADRSIPLLLEVPAAVRWVSAEPLLGPLELKCSCGAPLGHHHACPWNMLGPVPRLHWLVVGCESRGARPGRPLDLGWLQSLTDQCKAGGVPMFAKQAPSPSSKGLLKSHELADLGWPVQLPGVGRTKLAEEA